MSTLICERLSASTKNKVIFHDISINFPKNKIHCLIGPSGCGKSTFLLSLNGLIEAHTNIKMRGRVLYQSKDIREFDPINLKRTIATIFQEPSPLPFSIKKNFELPLSEINQNKKEYEEIIFNSLQKVGLWNEVKDMLNQSAFHLSGGQKQRLCLARSLALEPEIILLDEPTSALDPQSTLVIEDLLKELKRTKTIIMVTHNLPQAKRISDTVAFFWWEQCCGRVLEHMNTDIFFSAPTTEQALDYINTQRL
ncbi:MAG: phosphate ABC transporter ATP-binding protein [Bdellovibrionales bacterium CG12_big_fil_rev_8_21_14_0_65_38_15]|nr:MAG: phosphate ABC transporter ATP-binding protein [Bdellovibrionales bacterium CG22_combo_CG10-13_8_21_14_all_38_13]PIQ56749.1 MAG: phosphate ABC transporter ATP-binding protein [Bdellovibrionales bacterium CG12_big_fil_rev_8_21_14_0_65_38_15]PIR31023.1 MAG: phosphate ABC transporter ATP-binding protein [Bdellovibrionales bacterium CG11_big_fil_rev_8_21_14_0_20_38_13]